MLISRDDGMLLIKKSLVPRRTPTQSVRSIRRGRIAAHDTRNYADCSEVVTRVNGQRSSCSASTKTRRWVVTGLCYANSPAKLKFDGSNGIELDDLLVSGRRTRRRVYDSALVVGSWHWGMAKRPAARSDRASMSSLPWWIA